MIEIVRIDWGEITQRELKLIIKDLEDDLAHCREKIVELQNEVLEEQTHEKRLLQRLRELRKHQHEQNRNL
ncbi:MAG: hypothetical protein QMD61_07595 [Methanobacterium sp.]|nr:hypothetical protein [Methanobacterium sp.]